ncbi:MAG: response regulator transcription factor [Firmicutes bacterium]|nr:response regulator transcription factor [Bacillota bacterium]
MSEEKKKILIIEDEASIAEIIKFNLEKEEFEATIALDGNTGLAEGLSGKYDLILLDLMLPGLDGYEVCRRISEKSTVPIIIVSAKEDEADKVKGLELGADGYITKPFGIRELIARIRALLRRNRIATMEGGVPDEILNTGNIILNTTRYDVLKNGKLIPLTIREFDLLYCLAKGNGQIFSREELMEKVWGYEYFGDIRTVDVTVRRLREKLEDDPSQPKYIRTKRSLGYFFQSSENQMQ